MSEFFNEIISGKGGGGDGGAITQFWNPLAMPGEPKYQDIQAGVKKSGVFAIVDHETQFAIDQIPLGTANSIIQFDDEPNIGWRIISSTALQSKYTTPSIVDDETVLNATFPPSEQYSDYYCFVNSTNTYWQCKIVGTNFLWDNTGETTIDAISREEVNNLLESNSIFDRNRANHTGTQLASTISDFTESAQDAIGSSLLDTATIDLTYNDATNQISAAVKDLSLDNSKIAANAGIDTSKSKQSVITPVLARPQDGNTQEQINNSSLGLIYNLQTQIDTRPIGASNGSVYYLTSQDSAIANYELLSFSPDPSALDIESVTINSTTAKASRLIHSYIANYEIGSAIVNGGNWLFNFYGYVSHLNSSRFEIDVFKRAGATETLLFTCETTDFSQIAQVSPALNIANVETTQQDFACNTTDKIVIKIYGKTDRTQDVTITLLHSGTDYASHIHTPLIVTHNNLVGVQGGSATEKYHLTLEKYNDVQALNTNLAGKVNTADLINSNGFIKSTLLDPLYQPDYKLVANQTARFALTKNDVQNGDTVQQSDTQALYLVVDDTNLSNANGYSLNIAVTLPDDLFRKGLDDTDDILVGNAKFVTANEKTNLEIITASNANGFIKVSNGVASLQALIQNSELVAGINVNKLANGTVSNEELQMLDGVDITKTIQVQINELKAKAIQKRYVSAGTQGYGSDSYDGKSEALPFATYGKLNSSLASGGIDGSGFLVTVLPSQSTESVTFTQANIAIVGEAKRDFCGTTGTITANPASSSQVYQSISAGTFVKAGAFYVILDGVTAKTALSHTGTGSLDIIDSDFSTVPLSLTSSGTTRLYNCRGGVPTLNNASAFLFVGGNESLSAPTITAGLMFLKDCIISGLITLSGGTLKMQRCTVVVAQGTTLTIGASGSLLTLDNVEFVYPDGTSAKINIPTGVFFSFSGLNTYKDTSTLSGTDLSASNSSFIQNVKINTLNLPNATASTLVSFDANKNLVSLSTGTYPSLTEISYVKGGTSAFQTQLNAKAPLISPALTGTPTAPTAVVGTNNTQIATTEFATALINALKGSPTVSGDTLKELEDRIITLESLLSTSADGDSIVNTYYELLQAAQNFPEGSTFLGELNKRVSFGTLANRPSAVAGNNGYVYVATDGVSTTGSTYISNGTAWVQIGYSKTEIDTSLAGKEPTLTKGNLTEATSSVLTITGGTSSVIGSGVSITVKQATASQAGYVSAADWSTFNAKESAITAGTATQVLLGNKTLQDINTLAVLSATKFATPRNINGVSFDGTADITVADTTKQPLDARLTALANLNSITGFISQTGTDTFTKRIITGSNGIRLTNGNGVGANPIITPDYGRAINTITQGNDARLGTKDIDETNIANNRIPVYNSTTGNIEYQDKPISSTNLSIVNKTATTLDIASDTGSDATIPEATITEAGLLSASDKTKLRNTSGTNTGDQDLSGLVAKANNGSDFADRAATIRNLLGTSLLDAGKYQSYDANGTPITVPAPSGTGNVSATSITGATGQPVVALNDTMTALGRLTTVALKQSYTKGSNGLLCLTITERDSLSWVTGDIIYNTTYHRIEKYNGTYWVSADGTVGMFAFFDSATIPLHYLLCDASQIPRTGVYSELWALNSSPNPTLTPITFTITIATPAVITKTGHGLTNSQRVRFVTTGTLPTGITTGVDYIVAVIDANTFRICTSPQNAFAGIYVATSGTQSGGHTYTNTLYGQGNGIKQNAPDGRGVFLRSTDPSGLINSSLFSDNGSLQGDAIRNIIGKVNIGFETAPNPTGAFYESNGSGDGVAGGGLRFANINFDASRVVPTADENRPKSYSSTLCIKYI